MIVGEGGRVSLHTPPDGRVVATLVPLPPASQAEPDRPAGTASRPRPQGPDEWLVVTPEGYFDASAHAYRSIRWNVDGELYPAEQYRGRFHRPDLVRQALRGVAGPSAR
jgi:hypothetical protein